MQTTDGYETIYKEFIRETNLCADLDTLEALRLKYFGKKGVFNDLAEELKNAEPENKRDIGQKINTLKAQITSLFASKQTEISENVYKTRIDNCPVFDEELLINKNPLGSYHPITLVQRTCEEIFRGMGFTIEDYSEITDDFNCFEALNIPPFHPARDMQDTYYLSNGQVLKTHTSAAQNTIMKKYGAPLRAVFPGRCFRNEAIDACHENTFFQMEGIMIDKDISVSNLIYFMKTMLSEVFGHEVKVRLRPGFFPFVEPGFELDINCQICGGKGCPSCKNSGWLELCPCGMIHPKVLEYGGIDIEEYSGFAFGLGLTRLAMMKYGVKDIRTFNGGNIKALSQFTNK
ncbi:MAG: phenylalanine--tRNA ligase subunit alpha [Christensenellaceae bacterium]|jgi:phenylalanyl-tRNA synthetase alpha chain|nr:phenylalanine--tRNA ligase subunit alpha [Christensenellaceae bacterium]